MTDGQEVLDVAAVLEAIDKGTEVERSSVV
jgi:hypothetical protein